MRAALDFRQKTKNPGDGAAFRLADWPFAEAVARIETGGTVREASPLLREWLRGSASIASLFKPAAWQKLSRTIAEADAPSAVLPALALADGRLVDVEIVREAVGALVSLRDTTALGDASRRLVRAQLNAELALRSRAEFLGRMSHELRTPLNSVIGFSEMIAAETEADPARRRGWLGHVIDGGRQLLERIDHLGAVSEAELGLIDLCAAQHSLREIVERAAGHLTRHAFERSVAVRIEPGGDVVATVDGMLMIGVVGRLLSNAVDACSAGGTVTVLPTVEGGRPTIRIRDTGCGMPTALVAAIREAFVDGSLDAFDARFGCGLVVCRDYLRLHQATLDVVRSDESGTELAIRLPASSLHGASPSLRRYAEA